MEIINTHKLRERLENLDKKVEGNSMASQTVVSKRSNAKTNVVVLNATVSDYGMIQTHAYRNHSLHSK